MPKKNSEPPPGSHRLMEIWGLFMLTACIMMLLSLLSYAYGHPSKNWLGFAGYIVGSVLHGIFGLSSYLISIYLGWIGICWLLSHPIEHLKLKTVYFSLFIFSSCMLLSLFEDLYPSVVTSVSPYLYPNASRHLLRYRMGGIPFYYFYGDLPIFNFKHAFNSVGVFLIFSSIMLASLIFFSKSSVAEIIKSIRVLFERKPNEASSTIPEPVFAKEPEPDFMRYVKLRIPEGLSAQTSPSAPPAAQQQEMLEISPDKDPKTRPSVSRKEPQRHQINSSTPLETPPKKAEPPTIKIAEVASPVRKREAALKAQAVHNGDFTDYKMPPLTLLTSPKKVDQSALKKDLRKQAEVLEETLLSFGIEAKVGQINCGPTITSFEVHPAIGVKVQKIKTLENDIALNLEAKSIRIIAPIPGKAAVGIEVPNPYPQEVSFKEMLNAYQQGQHKLRIPLLLGKAVNGDYVMSDLTKMPHCIIAGATGSGKSVCINTIVMSILYAAKPDEIQLLMVDPKKVELTPYTRLPHMIAPVITEPQGAYAALQWLVREMENRYEILKQIGVRNIEAFNQRTINAELEKSLQIEVPTKLPYIVGIVDELADLMMVANTDIETPIARIAQMARAVGIHLILATQRPSREVITGLIKANFPTRISFKVASRVNSQIVLDETGAESLLGNGDMLFLPPGTSHLVRAQGAYIRDEDIQAVVKSICDQAPPQYRIPSFDQYSMPQDAGDEKKGQASSGDTLYDQALDIVLSTGNASTTFLQRKLKIGYARAASLMDELQKNGVVSAAEGSKARRVLHPRGTNQDEDPSDPDS